MAEADELGEVDVRDETYRNKFEVFLFQNQALLERVRKNRIPQLTPEEHNLLFLAAAELAEKSSADNPTRPRNEILRDLKQRVVESLGLEGEDRDLIEIFLSVNTPLDHLFGISGLLRWKNADGEVIARASFAYMTDEKRARGTNADAEIERVFDPERDKSRYDRAMKEAARKIVFALRNRRNNPRALY